MDIDQRANRASRDNAGQKPGQSRLGYEGGQRDYVYSPGPTIPTSTNLGGNRQRKLSRHSGRKSKRRGAALKSGTFKRLAGIKQRERQRQPGENPADGEAKGKGVEEERNCGEMLSIAKPPSP